MGTGPVGRVALMSLKPQFAHGVLNGSKRVEFRKRPLAGDVTHIVIYGTAPTKRIVGYAEIAGQDRDVPQRLWARYAHVGGISHSDLIDYFDRSQTGVAIGLGRVWRYRTPIDLSRLASVARAPQSYQYLSPADSAFLITRGRLDRIRDSATQVVQHSAAWRLVSHGAACVSNATRRASTADADPRATPPGMRGQPPVCGCHR